MVALLIGLYLAAIVGANLFVTAFGPEISIVNAFFFIGFDLVARDRLHQKWAGNPVKLGALIAAGSLLSWVLNQNAGPIAVASLAAFALAGLVDALGYHLLRYRPYWQRVNGSNIPAALVDSLVFPLVAFGWPLLWPIVAGQFVAKVFGGALWSGLLNLREGQRDLRRLIEGDE